MEAIVNFLVPYQSILIPIAIIVLLLVVYTYSIQPKRSFPPSGLVLPIVGSMWGYGGLPRWEYYSRNIDKWGPVVGGRFGPFSIVNILDANLIEEYWVKQSAKTSGRMATFGDQVGNSLMGVYDNFDKVTDGFGILAADGPTWTRNRRLAWISLFTKERVKVVAGPTIGSEVDNFMAHLDKIASTGTPFDPTDLFSRYTLRIISALSLGRPVGFYEDLAGKSKGAKSSRQVNLADESEDDFEDFDMRDAIMIIFDYMSAKYTIERSVSFLRRMPWARWPVFLATVKRMRAYLGKLVSESENNYENGFLLTDKRNFIDILVESRHKNAEFSDVDHQDIVTMLLDFVLAGTDTTSNTLAFLLGELINRPQYTERLVEEIQAVCGDRSPTLEDLDRLVWTDALINETLRLHTIAPFGLPHRITDDIQIGQYHIPKNTMITATIYAVHHNEKIWGDPYEFRPERWIDDADLKRNKWFIPFSTGARICPGRYLSMAEAKLLLAAVFQRFRFSGNAEEKVVLKAIPGLTVRPAPYLVSVKRK